MSQLTQMVGDYITFGENHFIVDIEFKKNLYLNFGKLTL